MNVQKTGYIIPKEFEFLNSEICNKLEDPEDFEIKTFLQGQTIGPKNVLKTEDEIVSWWLQDLQEETEFFDILAEQNSNYIAAVI